MDKTPSQEGDVGNFKIKNMENNKDEITYFARGRFGTHAFKETIVGIKKRDRRHHFYIIGKTGSGKSTMMENMIVSDIISGCGVGLIDPHGDLSQRILSFIPSYRVNNTIYLNPSDIEWPISVNILEKVNESEKHIVASSIVSIFKKTWSESWGPRLEHVLRNTILALLVCPSSTILGANKILVDEKYRNRVIKGIKDPIVKSFWVDEFNKYPERFLREVISPMQNKLGALLSNTPIRNIIGQRRSSINLEHAIRTQKILIINLSKGLLGEDASRLMGTVLVTKLQLAAMAQAKIEEEKRKDFYLYIDEFQNFSTKSFIDILSEARKYRLNLILAHQYLEQLDEGIKEAVLGNVGTIVCFRIGASDVKKIDNEFLPEYSWQKLANLNPYEVCVKLMLDGKVLRPYVLKSLPPVSEKMKSNLQDKIIEYTRKRYCKPRKIVEKKIENWMKNPTV